MSQGSADGRRALPAVDTLLQAAAFGALAEAYGRDAVVTVLRAVLADLRAQMRGAPSTPAADGGTIATECERRLRVDHRPSLRPVINLTGTVLHTNLGRALLPEVAVAAAHKAMTRAVNLEYDLDGAHRGERDEHVESLLTRLTGAEAATVVNNNAAAVYLVLNALAAGREVIVSRGELIEIGGSFRIPDIMESSGCRLREVGTTNRTHLADYARAIAEHTAALMKVHTSNYAIQGFTASVGVAELATLAHDRGLPLIDDLGSGTLVDLERYGLPHEPTAREAIMTGADVVTFSGDKLLGGPQCGMIVGKRALIERIRRHPMKRALRLDKIRLAALEAVLRLYGDPDRLAQALPALRSMTRTAAEIRAQAERVLPAVAAALSGRADVRVVACTSQIGSGAMPVERLPSSGLAARPCQGGGGADRLATAFRSLDVPVIGRISDDEFLMDLRCLEDEHEFLGQLASLGMAA